MHPLTRTEQARLRATGALAARLDRARRIGNHRPDPFRLTQAIRRTARRYFQAKGLSRAELDRLAPLAAPPPTWRGLPTTGTVKVLAVLIDFPDHPHTVDAGTINNALFGDPATGDPYESLAEYYRRSSHGALQITGNTLGWYRCGTNRSDIESGIGRDGLIKEALQHFDSAGHDFSQYDNDHDGVIEYFLVFWTGPDNGWANFWWGYQTGFLDAGFKVDNVGLSKYSWQWESNPVGTAFDPRTPIHETGHALGLPDLYDYDDDVGPDGGVGGFDMMDSAQFDHNCFSKWMLDWVSPTVVPSGQQRCALNPAGTALDCVAVWPGIDSGDLFTEMFMIENRQRVGNDVGLPGQGLLIWHIDTKLDASNNYVCDNSFTAQKMVRLMEADGREDIEANRGGDANDFYPQGASFGPNTTPNSAKYDGSPSYVEVRDIAQAGTAISATIGFTGMKAGQVAVAAAANCTLAVFAIGADCGIYRIHQTAPDNGWSAWERLGTTNDRAKSLAVGKNADGRLEVFAVGLDNGIYHVWQISPNGQWTAWQRLAAGDEAKSIAVGTNRDGRLEIFYVGTNDRLYHNWQVAPNGGWHGQEWLGVNDYAKQIAVGRNKDGRLEVFYVGTNDHLYHNWQKSSGGWNGEAALGGSARHVAVGQNQDGRLEVFYVGTNGEIYHNWQKTSGGWSGEAPLGGAGKQIEVAQNADGRLEVLYVGTNDALYHDWQTAPNNGWSGEAALGGQGRQLAIGHNADGRLEVCYVGTDGVTYHDWQTAPNSGWSGEARL